MRAAIWRPLLLALLAACPRPAGAADWTPDTTRLLGDPAFLPLAGQIASSVGLSTGADMYREAYSTGSTSGSWNRATNAVMPSLSYGITDDLSISADMSWGNIRGLNNFSYLDPNSCLAFGECAPRTLRQSTLSAGPVNPTFGATWRVLDQRAAPVSVDLALGYSPDIYAAREASTTEAGTVALGGQRVTLEASVSRETRFMTVRGYVTLGYDGRRNVAEPASFDTLRMDARPDVAVGVQTQTRLASWVALNAGVAAQKAAPLHQESEGGSFVQSVRPGGAISPYVGLVAPVLDRRIAMELLYQHDFIGNETVAYPYGTTEKYSHQGDNIFLARLLFVFGTR